MGAAKLVADSAQQDFEDDIGRNFNPIAGGASALVIIPTTGMAAKDSISSAGSSFLLGELSRLAVRTIDETDRERAV
jgi:hypothetical protein